MISNLMASNNVPGLSIALVEGTNLVWSAGFGYADAERGTPATASTVYGIGSVSKTLTALLVLKQYDDGLIDLDASITNYIAEFSMRPRFAQGLAGITVRRMLSHHSGIPGDIFNGLCLTGPYRSGWVDWLIEYLADSYAAHPPGEAAVYCNNAFVLLGEIVARNAGTNLPAYGQAELFGPLGMTNSAFTMVSNNVAMGYVDGRPLPAFNMVDQGATGGAYASADDMAELIKLLLCGGRHPGGTRLVASNTLYQVMGAAAACVLDLDSYFIPGLGWDTVDDPVMQYAGRTWQKGGSTWNFETLLEIVPDQNLGVIVLANSDTGGLIKYQVVHECLRNAVSERGGPEAWEQALPESAGITNVEQIAGNYVLNLGFEQISANRDGTLNWRVNMPQQAAEITLASSNGCWRAQDIDYDCWWTFTNVAAGGTNHTLMMRYGNADSNNPAPMYGAYLVAVTGQRHESCPMTDAWSNRLDKTYIIYNSPYDDMCWVPAGIRFVHTNGVLLIDHGIYRVLDPVQSNLAFVAGLQNRGDSCVRVVWSNGNEQVVYDGRRGMDRALVPDLSVPGNTNGSVRYHTEDWYRLHPCAGRDYTCTATPGNPTNVIELVLMSEDLGTAITNGWNGLRWVASSSSSVYLALSPVADAQYSLSARATASLHPRNDYDGDGCSDLAVTGGGDWYMRSLKSGVLAWQTAWGWAGATPVPGDYDGDTVADLAVFDVATGYWYIRTMAGQVAAWQVAWGWSGVEPVSCDCDGDGCDDLTVFDSDNGLWYSRSLDGAVEMWGETWGWPGAQPLSGDYDGDGVDDLALFDGNTGNWYIRSSAGQVIAWELAWGWPDAMPVPGDYDGDGADDVAVFDSGTGSWYVRSIDGQVIAWNRTWGWPDAMPVPGDYDGDGADDMAVFDVNTGCWYISSVGGNVIAWAVPWGWPGAQPVGGDGS